MRTKMSSRAALGFALLACLIGALAALAPCKALAAETARNADCRAGTLVTVVAHLDDDLLFVDPGITDRMQAGWCIVTVHLIGGANSSGFDYVLTRERAIRQTYARMAGVPNAWTPSTVTIAGKPVFRMTLDAAPRIELLEMRLPGGQVRGGRVPLGLLWDEGETIVSYPMNADGSGATRYDRASLIATLGAILKPATEIFTLNPDTVPFLEHPDHIYAARITRHVARAFGLAAPIRYHLTYITGALPMNVPADKTQRKRDAAATYFALDGGDTAQLFGEYEWNGDWVARRYAFSARSGASAPDFEGPAFNLVNAYASSCLTAGARDAPPRLAACDGSAAQDWRWQPLASYPGNPHNAALVEAATSRCVAERGGALVEEACNADDIAQRWTPWDFGIVRTPHGHCLGEEGGALSLGVCGPLTSAYRWAPTPHSQWTDLRMAGAMYGDVAGNGKPSAVYVERRADGPGFDVWVAGLAPGARASRWYANAVRFDSKSITPSCTGDTLCFDSTRFLLGDFEGTGRADLMAIAERRGGTAFWLLRNTGTAFAAPRLWYQTTSALTPARAQQYVAADFSGHGRADVMVAARVRGESPSSNRGLDLWVLTSNGLTGNAPALWSAATALANSTRFLAARVSGSLHMGLFALEDIDDELAVTQLASTGHAFSARYRTDRFAAFRATFAKAAAGALDGSGVDGLVVLTMRVPNPAQRANIDVWTIAGGPRFGAPAHAGTIADVSWADAIPALVAQPGPLGDASPTLVLFRRANATLDEYHFTGGAPGLVGYPLLKRGGALGAAQDWGDLPGRYTETLRLDRLE